MEKSGEGTEEKNIGWRKKGLGWEGCKEINGMLTSDLQWRIQTLFNNWRTSASFASFSLTFPKTRFINEPNQMSLATLHHTQLPQSCLYKSKTTGYNKRAKNPLFSISAHLYPTMKFLAKQQNAILPASFSKSKNSYGINSYMRWRNVA